MQSGLTHRENTQVCSLSWPWGSGPLFPMTSHANLWALTLTLLPVFWQV
jgi:hypothetical protein